MKTLVIVESPAKAKTIGKFLGAKFTVKSSFGHLRDLPKNKLGVDVDNDFEPQYVISPDKQKVVKELKDAAKKTDAILFATDQDREGEAISWHLAKILGVEPNEAKRIAFHEITKTAIEEALKNPRSINLPLVDAQQARRILDRLVGYRLSPFLWRKVARGLSAGRVQSVAVRLTVEREREINSFNKEEYWTITGEFKTANADQNFSAKLYSLPDKKLDKMDIKSQEETDKILSALKNSTYKIDKLESKQLKRTPPPPFTTSTLQQEANARLGFSAKQTMRLAQMLYEGVEIGSEGSVGLITYMRTDSVNLSEKFLTDAAALIAEKYGKKYVLPEPRHFTNRSKNAQEAHEAIRATEASRDPESLKPYLEKNLYRLYDLIWCRALATQMPNAIFDSKNVSVRSQNDYVFKATGRTMVFDGFLKLYPDKVTENLLPTLTTGETANLEKLLPEQHFTEPPARYSDATLVKALEQYGIGRPSTYAPTIGTIEERGYVERDENKKLKPTDMAIVVNDILEKHFPQIVDYQFTAHLEDSLDAIARGEKEWQPIIKNFYVPFEENLKKKDAELKKSDLTEETTDEKCEKCGKPMVIKLGRYGKFMGCSGFPDCKNIKPLPGEIGRPEPEILDEKCEKCGEPLARKVGRYGPFLACSAYPKCKYIKNIEIKTGINCPQCKGGEIVERKSRYGKKFYSCNRYPDCKFALWNKPNGEKCPSCQGLLSVTPAGKVKCENKECPTYVARAPRRPAKKNATKPEA